MDFNVIKPTDVSNDCLEKILILTFLNKNGEKKIVVTAENESEKAKEKIIKNNGEVIASHTFQSFFEGQDNIAYLFKKRIMPSFPGTEKGILYAILEVILNEMTTKLLVTQQ